MRAISSAFEANVDLPRGLLWSYAFLRLTVTNPEDLHPISVTQLTFMWIRSSTTGRVGRTSTQDCSRESLGLGCSTKVAEFKV